MTLEETGKLLATMQQYWNMVSGKEPKAMAKAWHLSLSDIDYRTAVYAVAELSKTNKFAPTVAELREAAARITRATLPVGQGGDWLKRKRPIRLIRKDGAI